MQIFEYTQEITERIREQKTKAKTIGFVPTMGSLHQGHMSLVRRSLSEADTTIISIFVNPTQFNDTNDLSRYPRNIPRDLKMLEDKLAEENMVFIPGIKEMYPEPDNRIFDFGGLDKTMEGKFRAGHFNGVAQIVSKLFNIIMPDKAFFGEKDFQQLTIVKRLVELLDLPVEIVPCRTVREPDGLALSSRNELLTDHERKDAALIPQTLFRAIERSDEFTVDEMKKWVINTVNNGKSLHVEYFEIVSVNELKPVKSWRENNEIVGCIAVKAGSVRLIDNIRFPVS